VRIRQILVWTYYIFVFYYCSKHVLFATQFIETLSNAISESTLRPYVSTVKPYCKQELKLVVVNAPRELQFIQSELSKSIVCPVVLSNFNHLLFAVLGVCCQSLISFVVVVRHVLITEVDQSFLDNHTILLPGSLLSRILIQAKANHHEKLAIRAINVPVPQCSKYQYACLSTGD
jgi:hypothetical protein